MPKYKMNRRQFINTGAAAGVALHTATKAVSAGVLGANDTIRMGIIGSGGMGRFNMERFIENKDVAMVAIADVHRHQRDGANHDILGGKADAVEDYRRLLDRDDIDAVLICTPDHWHAIPTIHACQAGKDVYVEKPCAHNIVEGRRMTQAARKHDRVVQVGIQQTSGPYYIEAAKLVQEGKIGKVTHVRVWNFSNRVPGMGHPEDGEAPEALNYDYWRGPAPMIPYNRFKTGGLFRMFWDTAGGTMTDWGTHHMGSVHHIMGVESCESVYAAGGKLAIDDLWDTPDNLHVTWEFKQPHKWILEYTLRETNGYTADGSGYGIMFYGTDGTLYIDRSGFQIYSEGGRAEAKVVGTPRENNFMPAELSRPHIRNFLDCIKSRKRPAADIEFGHRATATAHLANVSFRVGRKITWDADKETVVGDEEASRLLTREYRKPYVLPEV